MRVAVHLEDGTVFAYRLGDIIEGHHNVNMITGEQAPISDVHDGLVKQAQAEFPDAKVVVEKLEVHDTDDDGNDIARWVSADEESPKETTDESEPESTEEHE